eukprot:GCRY01005008.1.p1 GENE.GCRY01005008.1~~GCRY01005008.1.p1  ORF type:complete len:185 (-),score=26.14 GCRY01005008.1:920-1474(-)
MKYIQYLNTLNEERNRKILFEESWKKKLLWELVKQERRQFPYWVEQMAKEREHVVLRNPPYHPELQPIELMWKQMKDFICANRWEGDFTFCHLKQLVEASISSLTAEQWTNCIEHVNNIVREWCGRYGINHLVAHPPVVVDFLQKMKLLLRVMVQTLKYNLTLNKELLFNIKKEGGGKYKLCHS